MVVEELARWGPEAPISPIPLVAAEAYCRRLALRHYENFPVVTWVLPRSLRQHFYNVYAFCRWADDLGDEIGDPDRSLELLGWWRRELQACFDNAPRHPVFVALRPTMLRFDIPQQPFADLISAFEQDQRIREYETFAQLHDYCRRSADPVGRIVLCLCERHRAETVAWSDSICTGLQIANFLQDVARDHQMGRVYLPREDRVRFGYTATDLNTRTTNGVFRALMEFEVERARGFLEAGRPLVEAMPGRLQVDVELFIRGGLQILREIERIGYQVWEQRPVVSKGRFAWMVMTSSGHALWRRLRGARAENVTIPLPESYRYCQSLARRTGRNFYFSFLTLPRPMFRDMCVLYAFMRHTDDLVDDPGTSIDERRCRLEEWRAQLNSALNGGPARGRILPALADVVTRHGIPDEHLREVISGVESDLTPRLFETFDDLAHYCYQVAGAVGLCCIHVWSFDDERASACAVNCGLALQLTNILRDLGEDARLGRIYLPRSDLRQFGYAESDLQGHVRNDAFRALMRFEIARARQYYERGTELHDYLPRPGRRILSAMLRIYGGLLDEIERRDYDVFSRRVQLSTVRKLAISVRSLFG